MNTHPIKKNDSRGMLLIAAMVISISSLHLFVPHDMEKIHVMARELYFLPVILSALWFGLRGAVITALVICTFYFSYSVFYWRDFSARDLDRLLEIGFFGTVAVIVGMLQDRQRARTREKIESIKALTATIGHEINSPLFVAMGTLELLQDDFDKESEPYGELAHIMKNLSKIKLLVKKISAIEEVVTSDYDGTSRIVDLQKSAQAKGNFK